MTKHFNKISEREKRRQLRKNTNDAEKLVWMYLRHKQVCGERFLRQFSVDHFVLDFYCPKLKLAIEIDGESHFSDEETLKYDKDREEYIKNFGIEFLRFRNEQVYQNLDAVFSVIEKRVSELRQLHDK